jgi:histidyl-tRNA synthetase
MSMQLAGNQAETMFAFAPRIERVPSTAIVALHYGFEPISLPIPGKEDVARLRHVLSDCEGCDFLEDFPDTHKETVSLIRRYYETRSDVRGDSYLLLWEEGGTHRHRGRHLRLEILGSTKSIAEAVLLKVVVEILREEKAGEFMLSINSIGDRESAGRFLRDLTVFYRRRAGDLPPACRQSLKQNATAVLRCDHGHCRSIREEAPRCLSYLSDPSRQHFREVLEYLETIGIPYEIDERLFGFPSIHSHTYFEVRSSNGKHLLAAGYRYNGLARRLGFKRDIPGISAIVTLKSERTSPTVKNSRPSFYFVQIGYEAKLKSLAVLDMLHRAGIPVAHSITKEKLSTQLTYHAASAPHMLIMGIKEALENSIIVRDTSNRSQETVPLVELVPYLKGLA